MGADLRFAHALADAADAITTGRFRAADLRIDTKPDLTPVSEADRGAEEAIRALVTRDRPGESVFGEEFGDSGGAVRWIVDPIDGTRNYVRGIPVWATLLALERNGQVDVAVVSAPILGRRWWAERGQGAWAGANESAGERLAVSGVTLVEDASVSTTSARDMPSGWLTLAGRAWSSRALGDFWQHCLVAEGALDVATDEKLEHWDYAAVQLIVEEAGGRCSTFAAGAPTPGASFVSTNGALHDAATALLSSS